MPTMAALPPPLPFPQVRRDAGEGMKEITERVTKAAAYFSLAEATRFESAAASCPPEALSRAGGRGTFVVEAFDPTQPIYYRS